MSKFQSLCHLAILVFCAASLHGQNQEVLGEYKIGIVGRDYESAVYQAAHLGAKDAASDLSRRYSIDVELLVATPTLAKGGSQPESLAGLFVDDADGFIISPDASSVVGSTVQFAKEQDREVVYFESDLPGTEPLAAILADEFAAGRMAADAILEQLPTTGRVGILTSSKPTIELEERLRGARAVLGFRGIQTVVQTAPDYRSAIRALEQAVEADLNDQITGWIFLEDWPLRGLPALPWAPGRTPVVAIQSSPSAFLYSERGYLDAIIAHPYYEWGYNSVEVLVAKLHKNQEPEERKIVTKPSLINARNFEDYRKKWKIWLR